MADLPDDLRPWVERTAPLAKAAHWATIDALLAPEATGALDIHDLHDLLQWMVDHGAPEAPPKRVVEAMAAYRDEVARGLTWDETATLSDLAKSVDGVGAFGSHTLRTAESLADKRLVARRTEGRDLVFGITPWGRAIAERARVLKAADALEG